ncbi:hypothetical protein FNCP11_06990 [Fusobacterium nucleatum]|jgi:aspartate aminotransferase|uniref:hypothetical protein n=1 Tax=Fusobacterium TaxID=848 RepID=UPI00044538A2|nr:hypothetical protein HMPREF1498_0564 [Fusobacterium sp. CM1]BEO98383.1 hypothetical protein FNCP11_06990 [Fusobacterium nucleatum]BEP09775.1 hypothetical protein FNSP11_06190 [Fusobacterium nucleatum]
MDKEKFLEEYLVERKGTNSLKWDALDTRFGSPDLISMWVADMEIKTPKEIIEALKKELNMEFWLFLC